LLGWHDLAAFRHVIVESLDFIAKLAAPVPKPCANLTRCHGVLAPDINHRVNVTPAKRGKGSNKQDLKHKITAESLVNEYKEMIWAQRLKRVFNVDITIYTQRGGAVSIIASIEDPLVIRKILDHLDARSGTLNCASQLPKPRAPPQARQFE
jgi:hypothetical protein